MTVVYNQRDENMLASWYIVGGHTLPYPSRYFLKSKLLRHISVYSVTSALSM
jgi:hypothetical protein